MNNETRKEVEAIINLVKRLLKEEKTERTRKGIIVSIDRQTNHATILLSDYSFKDINIPAEAPYVPGDSVSVGEDDIISPGLETPEFVGGNELVSNGDFILENLKHWSTSEFREINLASGESYTGIYCFEGKVSGSWEAILYQDVVEVSIIPQELYKHIGYLKTDSDVPITGYLDGEWYDSDANLLDIEYTPSEKFTIDSSDEWTKLITFVRPPIGAAYVRLKFCVITDNYDAKIYWDNLSFWGKSQAIPGALIPGLPGLDNIPPNNPTNLQAVAGVEAITDTYNYYINLSFDHIDTLAFASGDEGLIWDNTDFDHYEVYYKTTGNYELYGNYKPNEYLASGTILTFRLDGLYENTSYDLMIKSVDHIGNLSSGATIDNTTTLFNKEPHYPIIDSNKSNFKTEHAEVFWAPVTTNYDDTSAGIGWLSSDVKDYKVEVECSGGLVRTEYIAATHYMYSLDKNIADNGTIQPSGLFRIYARDFGDKLSSGAETTLINYPPAQPAGLSSDFTTRDAIFWWNLTTKDSQNENIYDFDKYQIELTPSGHSAETYYVENPSFLYKFEDNTNKIPNLTFKVKGLDKLGQASSWAEVSANNAVPSKAPTPTTTPAFKHVLVKWDSAEELADSDSALKDIVTTNLAHSNLASGSFNTINVQPGNIFVHEVEKDTHNYYKIQFVDIFNQSGEWSDISSDAYTEDSISIKDLAGEAYQLQATTSYSGTYYGASGENDITRLYDADWSGSVDFGSGEQWIQYQFPVTHIFNKTHIAFPSGDSYDFFLAFKRASGDNWTYLAGDKDSLSEYDDISDAYGDLISYSGTDVMLKWDTMREAQYTRFYFPSGVSQWTENKLCELKFDTYIIADQIDAGIINLAKGINLFNDEEGSGFRLDENGATFENGFISVLGDGYTIIENGRIWVRASGGANNPEDLSYFFDEENNQTVINGGYIQTGTIDAHLLRLAGMGYFINRVKNPSLEVPDPDDDDLIPEYWQYSDGEIGTIEYGNNASFAKYGRRYLELCPGGDGTPCDYSFYSDAFQISETGIFNQTVNASGETITIDEPLQFTASCFIALASGMATNVLLNEYAASGSEVGELLNTRYLVSGYTTDYDTGYNRKTLTYTPTEGTIFTTFECEMDANVTPQPSGGWIRFDAFQIEEGNVATGFKVTYDIGTVILDSSGIIIDHGPDGARTTINKEGITVERGHIVVLTDNDENIDLVDNIKIGGNLLYNAGFEITRNDRERKYPDGWNVWASGDSEDIDYGVVKGYPDEENLVSAHYLMVNPSTISGDFLRVSSIKLPVQGANSYSLGGYYYTPPLINIFEEIDENSYSFEGGYKGLWTVKHGTYAVWAVSTAQAYHGTHSLKVWNDGGDGYAQVGCIVTDLTVPGQEVTLTVKFKGISGLSYRCRIWDDVDLTKEGTIVTGDGTWQEATITATYNANSTARRVYFLCSYMYDTDIYYMDACEFKINDVTTNISMRRSVNFDPVIEGYSSFDTDVILNKVVGDSTEYATTTLSLCSSDGEWKYFELEGFPVNTDGYLYVCIEVLTSGECVTEDIRLDSFMLEHGDRATKYDLQSMNFVENRFDAFKKQLVRAFNNQFIIEGLDMEVV